MSKLIVIDLGSQHIRILDGETRGSRVVVHRLTTIDVPESSEAAERELLRTRVQQALRSAAGSGARVIGLVGRSQAVLRDLRLPDAPADELPGMVELQAMRELSFPVEQAVIDFEVVGTPDSDGQRRVTLAAMQQEALDRYRVVLSGVQLDLGRLGLRPYATWRSYRQVAVLPEGAVLVISLAGESLELTVARDETVLFSRATLLRAASESKAESFDPAPILAGEVRRTLAAFTNQFPGVPVDRIALAAGKNEHQRLGDALAAAMSIAVDRFDPFQAIELGREFARESGASVSDRGAFAAAVGAAISANELWPIDFLNPKKPVVRRDRRKPIAMLAAAAAVLIVVGSYVAVQIQLATGRQTLERRNTELAKLQDALKGASDVTRQYQAVEQWTKTECNALEELRRITQQFPETRQMYVTSLNVNRDASRGRSAKIVLDGVAREQVGVGELNRRLNSGGYYRAQPVGQIQQQKGSGDYRWSFKTSIVVKESGSGESKSASNATARYELPNNVIGGGDSREASSRPLPNETAETPVKGLIEKSQ